MPVCHFTYHAYGTWLPDRPEGYFKHGQSWQKPDIHVAKTYRQNMKQPATDLLRPAQQLIRQTLIESQPLQRFELYAIASDTSHLHVVAAWRDDRDPVHVRSQIKSSLTRALNKRLAKQQWFTAKAGHTPVTDQAHLYELIHHYLPKHGLYWKAEHNDTNRR